MAKIRHFGEFWPNFNGQDGRQFHLLTAFCDQKGGIWGRGSGMAKSKNSVGITKKGFKNPAKFKKAWALGICVDFRCKSQEKSTFKNLLSLLQSARTRWQQRVSELRALEFRRLKLLASRQRSF